MTPQEITLKTLSPEAFAALGAPSLVYVREVRAGDILAEFPDAFGEEQVPPDQLLYSVHRADGARMAVLGGRDEAYAAALAHDLAPVSVH